MANEDKSLAFARFYFGESARLFQSGVSDRLVAWSKAFESWVELRKNINRRSAVLCRLAWERLARLRGKMPWEITTEDIREHMRWMEEQGYKKGTINGEVGLIGDFYEWCASKGVDEGCGQAFNPTRGVARLRRERFEGASRWSREEVKQLLELVGKDESVLGKREKVFFLLRLNSGVALKQITNLKWEQIEQRGDDAWVRWSERYEPTRLPREVWAAMKDYLQASGRLDGMQKGKVIFAPLRHPYMEERGGKAEDWIEENPITNVTMLENLRVYGRRLGIERDKLNMHALRRTALRLRLEAGESVEGMRQFMDSQEDQRFTGHRLRKVPRMVEDDGEMKDEVTVPARQAKRFREGEGVKHGMFRHKQDMLAVKQVMEEGLTTLDDEINCLRMLMQGLVELEASEGVTLEAYTMAIGRLGELVAFGRAFKTSEELEYEDWLKSWDEMHARNSGFPTGEQLIAAANQAYGGVNVQQEVAMLRVILRNVYHRAETCQGEHEYVRLVDLYGKGCIRLMRLLDRKKDEMVLVQRYAQDMINQAIREVSKELGIDEIWGDY